MALLKCEVNKYTLTYMNPETCPRVALERTHKINMFQAIVLCR